MRLGVPGGSRPPLALDGGVALHQRLGLVMGTRCQRVAMLSTAW
jgi:hypothetical protein